MKITTVTLNGKQYPSIQREVTNDRDLIGQAVRVYHARMRRYGHRPRGDVEAYEDGSWHVRNSTFHRVQAFRRRARAKR